MGCAYSTQKKNPAYERPSLKLSGKLKKPARVDLSKMTKEELAKLTNEQIALLEIGNTPFFTKLCYEGDKNRDYILIVDKSGSMVAGDPSRWKEAEEAVKAIAPAACHLDQDGITLYFFSGGQKDKPAFVKHTNVTSSDQVVHLFEAKENQPNGGTDLAAVLKDAFLADIGSGCVIAKPKTILVITDGEPDSQSGVEEVIIEAANSISKDSELSVTIIQVGKVCLYKFYYFQLFQQMF
jgi:uncharacterized protein with von Willebrand factor type A (vWA) domain